MTKIYPYTKSKGHGLLLKESTVSFVFFGFQVTIMTVVAIIQIF